MWSYYDLTVAQHTADRLEATGYALPAAACREFPQDAICRALVDQQQADQPERRSICRAARTIVARGLAAIVRTDAAFARS